MDWSRFDRVVLRSAWDYPQRLPEFLAWLDEVDAVSDLVNPPETVRWNLDKQYLAELAEAGVPITPTVFVPPGTAATFPAGDFVVKPAVGAGSRDAASYGADQHETAVAHVARLHASGQTVLVQPFLKSVATEGEWPLMFFDGRFSHAASKRVALPQAGAGRRAVRRGDQRRARRDCGSDRGGSGCRRPGLGPAGDADLRPGGSGP